MTFSSVLLRSETNVYLRERHARFYMKKIIKFNSLQNSLVSHAGEIYSKDKREMFHPVF